MTRSLSIPMHRPRLPIAGALLGLLALTACYAMSPLVTLWSLASALRHDDVPTLRAALDWRDVRSGLKADIDGDAPVSLASDRRPVAAAQDDLPDFGSSFATTIVSHAVDDIMTPEHLVSMLSHDAPGAGGPSGGMGVGAMLARVQHVGFVGPAAFEARVRLSDTAGAPPIVVTMRLEKWHWKVTRIRLPQRMLDGAGGGPDRT